MPDHLPSYDEVLGGGRWNVTDRPDLILADLGDLDDVDLILALIDKLPQLFFEDGFILCSHVSPEEAELDPHKPVVNETP